MIPILPKGVGSGGLVIDVLDVLQMVVAQVFEIRNSNELWGKRTGIVKGAGVPMVFRYPLVEVLGEDTNSRLVERTIA